MHFTPLRSVLTRQQAQQRGFTTATATHHSNQLAFGNIEIDVSQDRSFTIGKRHIADFDVRIFYHLRAIATKSFGIV